MRTGGVEPPQREATALQAAELTECSAFAGQGGRSDSNRRPLGRQPSALGPLSYIRTKRDSAGGIRTRGLELMRLAGTASPLPRNLPGWSRTSGLRLPKPAGCPAPLQAEGRAVPPAGVEPAPSRLRAGRHHRSTTGAWLVGGAGIEPAPARYQRAVPPRTPASDEAPAAGFEPAPHD